MSNLFIPNSFQTPNILVDKIMPLLTPEEWVVLSFATRAILGWQTSLKTGRAKISLSRFEDCGLSRPTIIAALKPLEEYGLLEKVGKADKSGQEWQLAYDGKVDVDGLEQRRAIVNHRNAKRTENARSVGLTGQSHLPVTGQSDLHNETQDINTINLSGEQVAAEPIPTEEEFSLLPETPAKRKRKPIQLDAAQRRVAARFLGWQKMEDAQDDVRNINRILKPVLLLEGHDKSVAPVPEPEISRIRDNIEAFYFWWKREMGENTSLPTATGKNDNKVHHWYLKFLVATGRRQSDEELLETETRQSDVEEVSPPPIDYLADLGLA